MSRARLALAAMIIIASTGCSIDRIAADNMAPVLRRTQHQFERGKNVRAAREAAPGLLATLDGIIATSPDNDELLLLGAEMNATFGFAFLEEEDKTWARECYEKARDYAMRALEQEDDDLAAAIKNAKDPKELTAVAPEGIDEDIVPHVFWLGFAWGSRINLSRSDPKALTDLWKVEQLMKWVLDRDEKFFDGGPHLFFAVRYASFAKAMGGDPAEAKKHFDKVDEITGGKHLMARVLRAQFYAAQLQDTPAKATTEQILGAQKAAWDEFYKPLVKVLEAYDDLWPERNLANAIAKQRAKALLEKPSRANIIPPQGVQNPYAKKRHEEDE